MGVKFSNNGHSTLAASISSSDTSLTVASGHGARFPSLSAGDYFYATLIDASNNLEIVKCTARSSDVLTITRGQESTTARAYAIGDRIELRVTAQGIADATDIDNALPDQSSANGKYLTSDGTNSSWGTVTTYSLPSQTGNSGKFLTTNGTSESWGNAGGVLQVVHSNYSTAWSGSIYSSYQNIFSASITPTSSSSKILVICSVVTDSDGSYDYLEMQVRRGTTNVGGVRSPAISTKPENDTIIVLDSPSSTASLTYNFSIRDTNNDGGSFYVNKSYGNSATETSSFTLIELSSAVS